MDLKSEERNGRVWLEISCQHSNSYDSTSATSADHVILDHGISQISGPDGPDLQPLKTCAHRHGIVSIFPTVDPSISITCGIVLWANNKASSLLCAFVDCLDDVNQFLLVFQHPIQLIVVAGAEIAHHVFIAKEEHKSNRVVEFYILDVSGNTRGHNRAGKARSTPTTNILLTIHLLEVGDLIEIAYVQYGKVLDPVRDAIKNLVLSHAIRIPVTTKAYYYQAFVFGHDGLINMPCRNKMGQDDGAHW